ncbi:MAG: aspartate aminotransferase family protein [candidate division Zixibacteria bacterium]|nr:aspartate aminotransferase family protein [candidate division Zixibacteria bacterium]
MDIQDFRLHAHSLVDWMADYMENVRDYPVKSQAAPGDVIARLPKHPPENGESFEAIFQDFSDIVMPGITHWQHPSFFAYFPANSSPPSVLGEMLMATLGAQCMSWQTSPAAAELEERVTGWLRDMIGLPRTFTGVIQDTATTATLCSLLTAREKVSAYRINEHGFAGEPVFAVYCSSETHSSIEKDVKIAGLGRENLRKIAVDESFAMRADKLAEAIEQDLSNGIVPLCVVATLGTTGSTAIDPLAEIAAVCARHNIWLHVDAAFAGTALLLPEFRWMSKGIEHADTIVFNAHKWMFTNFDCSLYFVKDPDALIRTFDILPEYLKTQEDSRVNNYRDWGIQLGRRFRALKLWFVIRSYGVSGLQQLLRHHIACARRLAKHIETAPDFELLAPVSTALVCFRYHPVGVDALDELNDLNENLLERLNLTGTIYLTHTKLSGVYTLRMVTAQTGVTQDDVEQAWVLVVGTAREPEASK